MNRAAGPHRRRVLMIAYHYPPCRGSSGLQRTLAFSRYLSDHGWQPIVLTVRPSAYADTGADQLEDVPADLPVRRVLALDTGRHLAVHGRYPGLLAVPDRWVSWLVTAVPAGLRLIRQYDPDIIWSTYPIATAHLIGFALHRMTGIPWVTDFRDPMTEVDPPTNRRFPADPKLWWARQRIERLAVFRSARSVFVSASALALYRERYDTLPGSRWALIPNGYDESSVAAAERMLETGAGGAVSCRREPLTLLHSGVLYPTPDRDPTDFLLALARLRDEGHIGPASLRVVFRATGHDAHYRRVLLETRTADLVSLEPAIGYREALREMLEADGLLVFQGRDSNTAIPAKLYEYLRARRPILALVDDAGDTADLLRRLGVGTLAPLFSPARIAEALCEFLRGVRQGARVLDRADAMQFSREMTSGQLAELFEAVTVDRGLHLSAAKS